MEIRIDNRPIGDGHPVYIIAEIGINHNGDINIAKKLIDIAADAGCDAVKFQKRTPHLCVPPEQMKVMRDTPWGEMNYLQYRYKVEFSETEYDEIDSHCQKIGIHWFASPWDISAVEFLANYDIPCYKIPSAAFKDMELTRHILTKNKPVIASCGISAYNDITEFLKIVDKNNLILLHTNSTYPAPIHELNMRAITSLREKFKCLTGYSGHEAGLFTTLLAVPLGACCIERHITLDRNMWGSDHSASVEPKGLYKLVEELRDAERACGDGIKRIYPGEEKVRAKLERKRIKRPEGKVGAILQARLGSSRLPFKVIAKLAGEPLITRLLQRLRLCKTLDEIVVAIPDTPQNDTLNEYLEKEDVKIFRGSEDDVISRYLEAAQEFNIDYIVRVAADNPCLSPNEVDKIVEFFLISAYDFCSNLYEIQGNGYPDGIGAEVFSLEKLATVAQKAEGSEYREHVHRYFYDYLNVGTIMCPIEYAFPSLKLDVNTQEELDYIQAIYKDLTKSNEIFDINEIISWNQQRYPHLLKKPSLLQFKQQ